MVFLQNYRNILDLRKALRHLAPRSCWPKQLKINIIIILLCTHFRPEVTCKRKRNDSKNLNFAIVLGVEVLSTIFMGMLILTGIFWYVIIHRYFLGCQFRKG